MKLIHPKKPKPKITKLKIHKDKKNDKNLIFEFLRKTKFGNLDDHEQQITKSINITIRKTEISVT